MIGRTIEIYLPEANPRTVKVCSLKDSIAQALVIPRNRLSDFKNKLQDPGIYFLIGDSDELGKSDVYIGEAEQLFQRLKQHVGKKDFWQIAICFSSVKKNLNKAHIKFLENHSVSEASSVARCNLHNGNTPTRSSLTDQDRDFVLRFFEDLKILMGTLGYPIFERVKKDNKNLVYCKGKDASAKGKFSEEGVLVFKGSTCNLEESKTAGSWVTNMRSKLKEKGILVEKNGLLEFTDDYLFNSPSAAAVVILARRANGWIEWKTKDGKTIDELFRK